MRRFVSFFLVVSLCAGFLGSNVISKVLKTEKPEEAITMAKQKEIRWLNNLVAELLNVTPIDDPSQKEWFFTNPREGWVFIASTAKVKGSEKLWITIDEAPKEHAVIFHQDTLSSGDLSYEEAMCYLTAGKHTVKFWKYGQPTVERLIIRAIPELLFCKFQYDPHIIPHSPYNWTFLKRYVLPHVNTIVGSGSEEHLPFVQEWKKRKEMDSGSICSPFLSRYDG